MTPSTPRAEALRALEHLRARLAAPEPLDALSDFLACPTCRMRHAEHAA
jgi:hypothetical protein